MARGKKKETLTLEERLQAALVPESEQPYTVPGNWCWVRLGVSINLYNGDRGTNYPSKKDYQSNGVPFINAGAIVDGELNEAEFNYISEEKYDALRAGKIQQGDILYCLRGSLGKTAIVQQKLKGAISSSLCILRVNKSLLKEYLYYLLCSNVIGHQQVLAENGSAQPNLSAASVMDYMIPLSPLAEQQRIVDRIESLFAKLDEAKEKAQDALDCFETRKAAILHKAFTGELTAQWRKEHGVGMESWESLYLGDVFNLQAGKNISANQIKKEKDEKYKYPCFGGNGVRGYVENYNREGSHPIIGRQGALCGNVNLARDQFYATEHAVVVDYKLDVVTTWAVHYLRFLNLNQYATATAQPGLAVSNILKVPVKYIPYDEQQVIACIIDDLLAKEQQAKEAAEGVLEQIDLIKKSILARAFRGELGTNDPSEESTVELLKRVLAAELPPKTRAKAVSIPKKVEEQLKSELERKIIKLFYYPDSQSLPINALMEVSSKKFEVIESIRNLEQRGIINKLPNGNYKLVR